VDEITQRGKNKVKKQKKGNGERLFADEVYLERRKSVFSGRRRKTLMFRQRLYRAYPSDLTDAQWELLEPLIPPLSPDAVYWLHERREIVNGILYVLRSGCPWRSLPRDLPAWGTVYYYFRSGNAKESGIASWRPYVCRCGPKKAETLNRVQV
jgi:transposase